MQDKWKYKCVESTETTFKEKKKKINEITL